MARKRYSPEEIIRHLRAIEIDQAKGISTEVSCRKVGISVVTLHRWKKEYGGLRVDQAKRMKEMELENARLKKIVAEQSLDISILKEVAKGNF